MARNIRSVLSEAIKATLAAWLAGGKAADGAQVNSGAARGGCCSDFASEVTARLGGPVIVDAMGISRLRIDAFQVVDPDETIGRPFDRELIARHWPQVKPPLDIDWEQLDRLSEDAGFSGLTHTWLELDGLHYDAEAPDGVENFFDLPFLQRLVMAWKTERSLECRR
jgi:hypothetical protein